MTTPRCQHIRVLELIEFNERYKQAVLQDEPVDVLTRFAHDAVHFTDRFLAHALSCRLCTNLPPSPKVERTYLLTFTTRPDARDSVPSFQRAVEKQLCRSNILSASYALEHVDSNLHAHALVKSNRTLSRERDFTGFTTKFGHVDVRLVKQDNGIGEYITKENECYVRNDETNEFVLQI